MKKIRLTVIVFALIASMSVAVSASTDVFHTLGEQKVTKDIGFDFEPINFTTNVTESVFCVDMNDLLPIAFRTGENTLSVVIEKNDSVKTTKKETKKKETKKNEKKKKHKKKTKKSGTSYKSLGTFKVTGYCSCVSCCGKSNGITASGTKAAAGRTIAADTSRFPFGTKLKIGGHTYTVEDRGGAIHGNRIDMFFSSHSEALQWGVRYCTVYVKD